MQTLSENSETPNPNLQPAAQEPISPARAELYAIMARLSVKPEKWRGPGAVAPTPVVRVKAAAVEPPAVAQAAEPASSAAAPPPEPAPEATKLEPGKEQEQDHEHAAVVEVGGQSRQGEAQPAESASSAATPLSQPAPETTKAERREEQEQDQDQDHAQAAEVGAQGAQGTQTLTPAQQAEFDKSKIKMSGVLGRVRGLSEAEFILKQSCEQVLRSDWENLGEMGLALAKIRKEELYRDEYPSFEHYCRLKWQYTRRYVDYVISAAQVLMNLRTNCSQLPPQHEGQLRPLLGLAPEDAVKVWEHAVANAGKRKATEKLVRQTMSELQLAPPPRPVPQKTRSARAEHRRMIDAIIGELLLLLSQKAEHSLLTRKVEALHSHIHALLGNTAQKKEGQGVA